MKLLFISYFFDPFPGVGAKRVSYWAENCSKYGIDATVLTATKQIKKRLNIIYLPLSDKNRLKSRFIKDEGVVWEHDLKEFFKKSKFDYDIVLISGGPFMHFGIGDYLKNNYGCKIVLDYRDPFAKNTRFKDSFLKSSIKKYYQYKFNNNADLILTVNDFCKKKMKFESKVEVVPNGFDDTSVELSDKTEVKIQKGVIINGGKLHPEFDEMNFVNVVLKNQELSFKQIGKKYAKLDDFQEERLSTNGYLPYDSLVKEIKKAEMAVVMTAGELFETPTKIYDYIALGKKILIITDGNLNVGGIQSILSDYKNVVWSKNTESEIKVNIQKLQNKEYLKTESYKFSRDSGLKKMIDLLQGI